MAKYYTEQQVKSVIKKVIGERSKAATARSLGIHPQMLIDALSGHCIGPQLLSSIGFERVQHLYRRKGSK